tara:strand:+ start:723 stop:902 length:180 start_codon:yes stop_codon:yes gene_type:complete
MLEQGFNQENNPQGHPQKVMRELGIDWDKSEGHSMAECWIFEGCLNIPKKLPPCVKVFN